MAINFKDLKRNSGNASFEKLRAHIEKIESKKSFEADPRYWSPTVDKEGNGSAIIRFLPPAEGEEIPFVKFYDHGFEGPTGRWYINKSRTTLGEKDPVSDLNSDLWNSTQDDDSEARKIARQQKRRLHYVSNILVIRDPGNPDNEGKVFLYQYGKKVWDKINEMMHPEFEDEEKINPFDLWAGANFRMRIIKESGWRSYAPSKFESPTPVAPTDEKIEEIWKQTYPLLPEIAPDKFRSYEELEKNLREVIGNTADLILGRSSSSAPKETKKEEAKAAPVESKKNEEPPFDVDTPSEGAKPEAASITEEDEDEALAFFKGLGDD